MPKICMIQMPYKYKQFLINNKTEKIWIELCHRLNSNQIDLTVMLEKKDIIKNLSWNISVLVQGYL